MEIWESLPPRGAWIEMIFCKGLSLSLLASLPPRGAWIEIEAQEEPL